MPRKRKANRDKESSASAPVEEDLSKLYDSSLGSYEAPKPKELETIFEKEEGSERSRPLRAANDFVVGRYASLRLLNSSDYWNPDKDKGKKRKKMIKKHFSKDSRPIDPLTPRREAFLFKIIEESHVSTSDEETSSQLFTPDEEDDPSPLMSEIRISDSNGRSSEVAFQDLSPSPRVSTEHDSTDLIESSGSATVSAKDSENKENVAHIFEKKEFEPIKVSDCSQSSDTILKEEFERQVAEADAALGANMVFDKKKAHSKSGKQSVKVIVRRSTRFLPKSSSQDLLKGSIFEETDVIKIRSKRGDNKSSGKPLLVSS